ncbi:MAG: DUF222 domain-containing protein, partial [Lapillicoccus sp.]
MFEYTVETVRATAVGPLGTTLLALTDAEILALDDERAEALVVAAQRVINAASAIQAVAIEGRSRLEAEQVAQARAGLTTVERLVSGCPRDEHDFMPSVLAPLLHLSPRSMVPRYMVARTLCQRLPATLAAMRAGDIEPWTAAAIADRLPTTAAPALCRQVEDAIFPRVLRQTAGEAGRSAQRALERLDPDAVAARGAQARTERFVLVEDAGLPGLSRWTAEAPTETSLMAWAAIDELARRYAGDGDHRTLRQARADAFIDLILGNATVETTVQVSLPAGATPGEGGATPGEGGATPGEGGATPGEGAPRGALTPTGVDTPVGLFPADALAALVASVQTRFQALYVDPDTGYVTGAGPFAYRPHAALVRLV